jgi:hypothetical protein
VSGMSRRLGPVAVYRQRLFSSFLQTLRRQLEPAGADVLVRPHQVGRTGRWSGTALSDASVVIRQRQIGAGHVTLSPASRRRTGGCRPRGCSAASAGTRAAARCASATAGARSPASAPATAWRRAAAGSPCRRRHEAGALAGFGDDLARGGDALVAVAVQQGRGARAALHDRASFQARFWRPASRCWHRARRRSAACAPRRRSTHAAVHIVGQGQRARGVDRAPVHLPGRPAKPDAGQLRVDARLQRLGLQRLLGCLAGRQLVVDAPDVPAARGASARCCRGSTAGRRRPAARWAAAVDADVGDDEAALVAVALQLASPAAAAAGSARRRRHHPAGALRVGPGGRVDRQRGAVVVRLDGQVSPGGPSAARWPAGCCHWRSTSSPPAPAAAG